jgi:hypothetical protein
MHIIADISDGWERFANALSPTTPFPQDAPGIKLAAVLAPIFLVSLFTSSYMVMKMTGLIVGFGFFGDPLIWRGLDLLNEKIPDWQKYLEIRNTLLKGIPTNAQLTITLLHIGGASKAPLPPPSYSGPPPSEAAHATAGQNLEHLGKSMRRTIASKLLTYSEGASDAEISDAIHPDATTTTSATHPEEQVKKRSRFLAAIKGATKGGVESVLGTDRLKAAAGGEHAKNRLGVLKRGEAPLSGLIDFPARYKGRRGHPYITSTATCPALSWTTEREDVDPVFSIAVADIKVCSTIFCKHSGANIGIGDQESWRIGMENKTRCGMGDVEGGC